MCSGDRPIQGVPVAAEELTQTKRVRPSSGRCRSGPTRGPPAPARCRRERRNARKSGSTPPGTARNLGTLGRRNSPRVGLWRSGPTVGASRRTTSSRRSSRRTGKRPAAKRGRHRLVDHVILQPVAALRRERDHQPPVLRAAKRDAAVGDREDVLPERIGGPELLDHREIRLQARVDSTRRLSRNGKTVGNANECNHQPLRERTARNPRGSA